MHKKRAKAAGAGAETHVANGRSWPEPLNWRVIEYPDGRVWSSAVWSYALVARQSPHDGLCRSASAGRTTTAKTGHQSGHERRS